MKTVTDYTRQDAALSKAIAQRDRLAQEIESVRVTNADLVNQITLLRMERDWAVAELSDKARHRLFRLVQRRSQP